MNRKQRQKIVRKITHTCKPEVGSGNSIFQKKCKIFDYCTRLNCGSMILTWPFNDKTVLLLSKRD